jgi:hypothetical protein
MPAVEIEPRDGVYATSALFEAGDLPEESVSVPSLNAAKEALVEVADPPEDPEAKAAVR